MLLNIIQCFNWVDIFVIILLLRIGYISIKTGLPIEFFKLSGTIFALYLSLHYYTGLSDFIRVRLPIKNMPLEFLDFLMFMALSISGYSIFALLRSVFYRFIKMEAVPRLNKGGGFILGIGRAILLMSLIMFTLVISSISYFKNSVHNSYSGKRLFKLAPMVYSGLWNRVISKFMLNEKFNETILEVQKSFIPKTN